MAGIIAIGIWRAGWWHENRGREGRADVASWWESAIWINGKVHLTAGLSQYPRDGIPSGRAPSGGGEQRECGDCKQHRGGQDDDFSFFHFPSSLARINVYEPWKYRQPRHPCGHGQFPPPFKGAPDGQPPPGFPHVQPFAFGAPAIVHANVVVTVRPPTVLLYVQVPLSSSQKFTDADLFCLQLIGVKLGGSESGTSCLSQSKYLIHIFYR